MRPAKAILATFMVANGLVLANVPSAPRCLSQLQLRVRGDSSRVSSNRPLLLTIEVANTSDESVWLYGDLTYGLWLWVRDASGKELNPSFIKEHLPPPPGADDFLALRPAHSLMLHDSHSLEELGLRPGRYTAWFEFDLVRAGSELNIPACSGTLKTPDTVAFEVVE